MNSHIRNVHMIPFPLSRLLEAAECKFCKVTFRKGQLLEDVPNHYGSHHLEQLLVREPKPAPPPPPAKEEPECTGKCQKCCKQTKPKKTKYKQPELQNAPISTEDLFELKEEEIPFEIIDMNKPIRETNKEETEKEKKKKYECPKCDYSSQRSNNLKRHIEDKACTRKAFRRKEIVKIPCPKCEKNVEHRRLKFHLLRDHREEF